jgi:hypothetical protein
MGETLDANGTRIASLQEERIARLWDRVCDSSDAATFFHTRVWANVITATFPQWVSEPLVSEFSNGNVMVLPLMLRKGILPIRHYYESMPPGVYGGPVFAETPSANQLQAAWNALNELPSAIVCGNPFSLAPSLPAAYRRHSHTHVLDLRDSTKRIEKRLRKGHLANIAAARRKGVQITVASHAADVDSYFDVYRNSLLRWGQAATGFYPKRLFQNLFQLPQYGHKVKLWLAMCEDRVAAGAWIFYHRRHVVYWHGAMHVDYMSWHPVHLMLCEAIKEAHELGFQWFDFNPSGGLKGVEHFKRGFGAEQRDFFAYRHLGPLGKAFRVKRYLQESVLKGCSL